MSVPRKRRRRDERQSEPKRLYLQERDVDIIEAIHLYRMLSQEQVQALFFGAKNKSGAQRRLEKLYDHEFIDRKFFSVVVNRSPILYVLDRKGVELLRLKRGYDDIIWHSSDKILTTEFLEHTLSINDFRIAVTLACKNVGHELSTWISERDLKADYDRVLIREPSGARENVSLIPDGYFSIIANNRRYPFFLELDMGTMTLARFKKKVAAYRVYYESGAYQKRYHATAIRMLTVTVSQKRLENLKLATEEMAAPNWFWFGLLDNINEETVLHSPIWLQAGQGDPQTLLRVE